jgi:hypothetical protein
MTAILVHKAGPSAPAHTSNQQDRNGGGSVSDFNWGLRSMNYLDAGL